MEDEKKINHEFDWNRDPMFFIEQTTEDQEITLGPDLSWPLMSAPESNEVRMSQREHARKVSGGQKKAA
jgi:hypothetical protein